MSLGPSGCRKMDQNPGRGGGSLGEMGAWYGWEMCLGDGWLDIIQLYIYNAFITPTAHLKGMKTLREFLAIVCGSRLQFGAIRSMVRLTFWVLKIEAEPGSGRGI